MGTVGDERWVVGTVGDRRWALGPTVVRMLRNTLTTVGLCGTFRGRGHGTCDTGEQDDLGVLTGHSRLTVLFPRLRTVVFWRYERGLPVPLRVQAHHDSRSESTSG